MFRILILNTRKMYLNIYTACSFTILTTDDATIDKTAIICLKFVYSCIQKAAVTVRRWLSDGRDGNSWQSVRYGPCPTY